MGDVRVGPRLVLCGTRSQGSSGARRVSAFKNTNRINPHRTYHQTLNGESSECPKKRNPCVISITMQTSMEGEKDHQGAHV